MFDDPTGSVAPRKLKVVSITHGGITRDTGRRRYEPLLADPQIDLTLIAPDRWQEYGQVYRPEPSPQNFDVRFEKIRWPHVGAARWYFHHYPRLRSLFTALQPDVIHLWEEPWSFVALHALWLRDRLFADAALILETEQNILRRLPPPFQQIRRYTLSRADVLIGRSEEALDVSRACGFRGETAIVEYSVDRTIFQPGAREAARAAYGATGFTIGYVGRIIPEKGINDVLTALAQIEQKVSFFVLGAGPARADLEARVKSLGLSDTVRFLGPRPASEVSHFMNALDALVLMSRSTRTWKEQFGRVIMEAQACGVPVIGSNSGNIPAVIAGGGWTVAEGDAGALARLLSELVRQPESLAQASKIALHQAATRYAPATVSKALSSAYSLAAGVRSRTVCTNTGSNYLTSTT